MSQNYVRVKEAPSAVVDDVTSLNFYQSEAPRVKGTNSKLHVKIDCHHCRNFSYHKSYCLTRFKEDSGDDEEEVAGVSNFQVKDDLCIIDLDKDDSDNKDNSLNFYQAICLMIAPDVDVNFTKYKIVIDTGSSASMFCNRELLSNIKTTKKTLKLVTNGGCVQSNSTRMFKRMKISHNSLSLTNILSLSHVAKRHQVTIDTLGDEVIIVEIKKKK